jgi:branched-chain amino acid transport system ATP-binding protein
MHTQTRGWVFGGIVRTPAVRRSEREALDKAHDVMVRLGIETQAQAVAGSLSYGDQRRVEMARALVSQPDVLLLDEPAAGLNSAEKETAGQLIASLPEEFDLSVVLVEHDMGLVSSTCSHVLVMDYGQHLCDGPPATVLNDQRVVDAYLGTEAVQL